MIHQILSTLFFEPIEQLKACFTYFLGWKRHFNFYNLNPTQITQEQAEKNPILLLHGNLHNQSAWLSLAKALQQANHGPLYTVNLFHGRLSMRDSEIINAKIEEIKQQYRLYGKEPKIDLIGHSRGAVMAYYMGISPDSWKIVGGRVIRTNGEIKQRKEIRKIIRLGYPTTQEDLDIFGTNANVFDISGKKDILVRHCSNLPPSQCREIDCGHVGLLYSPAVHEQIIKWLNLKD